MKLTVSFVLTFHVGCFYHQRGSISQWYSQEGGKKQPLLIFTAKIIRFYESWFSQIDPPTTLCTNIATVPLQHLRLHLPQQQHGVRFWRLASVQSDLCFLAAGSRWVLCCKSKWNVTDWDLGKVCWHRNIFPQFFLQKKQKRKNNVNMWSARQDPQFFNSILLTNVCLTALRPEAGITADGILKSPSWSLGIVAAMYYLSPVYNHSRVGGKWTL